MNRLIPSHQNAGKSGTPPAPLARKKIRLRAAKKRQPATITDAGKRLENIEPAKLLEVMNAAGLLPASAANRDIAVEIPYPDFIGEGDKVTLYLNDTAYPVEAIGATDQRPRTTRMLPNSAANLIAEGSHTVTVQLVDFIGTTFNGVPAQPLRIDRTPPGGEFLPQIEFDKDAVEHGVTHPSLIGGYLLAKVPDWFGMEDFDIIEPYYTQNPLTGIQLTISSAYTQIPAGGASKDVEVKIPAAALTAIGDGPVWFGVVLRDQAGNASGPRLQQVPLTLILKGAPVDRDLSAPIIALFDDGKLIDEADARHPVEVQIPGFVKAKGGDTIVFYLGNAHTQPIPIDADEIGDSPILSFDLSYALFQEAGDGAKQYSADAYYKLYRGTALLATSPRPNLIEVDITTPGGTDPNPETPENENLRRATAQGASGTVNHITQEDISKNATVFVPWYAVNEASENVEYFKDGDTVSVQWGNRALAATHNINQTDLTNKIDLELIATSAEMIERGGGNIQVSYTVSRKQQTGPVNASLSPVQSVVVISTALLPGGLSGLDAGKFTEENEYEALNREAVVSDGGTPWRLILAYENVAEGDAISLTLQGYYELNGSGDETPNTTLTLNYTVVATDLPENNGGRSQHHDFLIETAYFAGKWDRFPTGRGSVTANYTIRNVYGFATARPQSVIVAVTNL